jgi:hypothetical protein
VSRTLSGADRNSVAEVSEALDLCRGGLGEDPGRRRRLDASEIRTGIDFSQAMVLNNKTKLGETMSYKWSKAFLEAGKRQLNGDTIREAGSDEVSELRRETDSLKIVVAELKNLILQDHYDAPSELTERIREWVDYYNHERYHEAIDNVTPADKYDGRDREVLRRREKVRRETMKMRRDLYRLATMEMLPNAISWINMRGRNCSLGNRPPSPNPFDDKHPLTK